MATTAKQVCRQVRQLSSHRTQWLSIRQTPHVARLQQQHQPTHLRTFSSSSKRREEEATTDNSAPYFNDTFFKHLDRDDQATYRSLTPSDRRHMERVNDALRDEFAPEGRTDTELEESIRTSLLELDDAFPEEIEEREPNNNGFFQMGEKEDIGPDDEFMGDDISSTAHGELEQHREIREYARNAAWEMPLLAQLAIPFQPPTNATPLRFRYTTYLGEQHPAANKVVVEFDPTDLQLAPEHKTKLIKLLGPRYNPSTGIAKMSSEAYETQAMNKRYLGDTVATLITEAKDTTDTFADVPADIRHRKVKPKLQFPERWLLTEERKAELEAKRAALLAQEEARKGLPAGLVDGVKEIEEARRIENLARMEAPLMAEAKASLPSGKQGKKAMGQRPTR